MTASDSGGWALATISNDDVELEARAMLRELIDRTAWFHHGMTQEQREMAIDQDVDRHWPLLAPDAAKRLIDRVYDTETWDTLDN
jgi:hypothetical protein